MKKIFLIIYLVIILIISNTSAQLPPAAQVLYDSANAQDSMMVNFALNNGAQFVATPDGNSFYIKWFPPGTNPSTTPLIVSLHGSSGFATHEFYSWYPRANLHGCGIIALQWYRPDHVSPYDYFPDDTLYSYLDSALTSINYPSGKALLHGFSRGSARSYAAIFNDIQSGNNYFCTTISNSGGADSHYPLYMAIDSGVYGPNVFAGKHWNLFCGGQDTNLLQSGCPGMMNTKVWLEGQGATVDIFIQDSLLDHNGFQLQTSFAYKDSILDNYLECFNGTLTVSGMEITKEIIISPNPFSREAIIKSKNRFINATLSISNSFGQEVMCLRNVSGNEIKIERENLQSGIYFSRIIENSRVIKSFKIIIID